MQPILERLAEALPELSPQLRKAACYVLENPNEIGVSSIREAAGAAEVKPNTLVRMARAVGFDGYEEFRRPFKHALVEGRESFPDRARWLQSIGRDGRHGPLLSGMAGALIENIESLFSATDPQQLKRVADRIVVANVTYVVGVGTLHALARNFAYLARMAIDTVVAAPRGGSLPVDDIARVGPGDMVIAMTFEPYRNEVVAAARTAKAQGAEVVAITDGRASPVAVIADDMFLVATETPQFFTSTVAVSALLETLMAFVIADADPKAIANIDRFHARRRELGVYWTGDG